MRTSKYSEQDLRNAVKSNVSISGVLRDLKLKQSGGAHTHIKEKIRILGIDSSHFTGGAWSAGKTREEDPRIKGWVRRPDEEVFAAGTLPPDTRRTRAKLKELGVPYYCSICKLDEWNGKKLTLELDHINGDRTDNRIVNYRYLCPNCHSQCETSTHSKSAL